MEMTTIHGKQEKCMKFIRNLATEKGKNRPIPILSSAILLFSISCISEMISFNPPIITVFIENRTIVTHIVCQLDEYILNLNFEKIFGTG